MEPEENMVDQTGKLLLIWFLVFIHSLFSGVTYDISNHPTKEVVDSLDKFRRRNQRNREDALEEAISEEVVTNTDIAEEREDELVPEQLLEVREPVQFQAHSQPGQPASSGHVGMDSLERSHGD